MPLKTKELYCGSRQHLHPDSHNDVQFCMNRVQAGKNFPVPRVISDCNRFSCRSHQQERPVSPP